MSLNALFIGLTTIDFQFLVQQYPEEDSKVKAKQYEIAVGGPATNASVIFSNLGGKSTLVSCLGKGHMSDFVRNDFKKYKVNFKDLVPDYLGFPVFASVISSFTNGSRTVYSYNPAFDMNRENMFGIPDLSKIDIILFDGFYIDFALEVATKAKKNNIPLVYDGGSWKPKSEELLSLTDILICSEKFKPQNIPEDSVIDHFKKYNIDHISVTRGSKPIICYTDGFEFEIPVEDIQAVDTLGAGDFFHGAFLFYYLQNKDFIKSLKFASKIAAKSCLHFGTRSWMERP